MSKKKVLVAMSGGVDSTVACALLIEQGYECAGVTMRMYAKDPDKMESSVRDAREQAQKLGIPHYVIDAREAFLDQVVGRFASDYERGYTPNPCVICNRQIKFKLLFDFAVENGYDFIATGHYGSIEKDAHTGRYLIRQADFVKKDQSYVLYNLTQEQLSRLILPLYAMDKAKVREKAKSLGFAVSDKPDSQDICFTNGVDYADFLSHYTGKEDVPGDFVDESGKKLGTHKGVTHYTIGMRKGLGIALGKPAFVKDIDPIANTVTLTTHENDLFSLDLYAKELNFIKWASIKEPVKTTAKIRYSSPLLPCTVYPWGEDGVHVVFDKPVRAVTPGQSVVFYEGSVVLGGGVIQRRTDI